MIATHPVTGEKIRILRTEATISRTNKTLLWIRSGEGVKPQHFRWTVLTDDPKLLSEVKTRDLICCIHDCTDAQLQEWKTVLERSEPPSILLVSEHAAKVLGEILLSKSNVLCTTELYDLYPYIETRILAETSVEWVVSSMAVILRMKNIVTSAQRVKLLHGCSRSNNAELQISSFDEYPVPTCIFITQYFRHCLNRRAKEIRECLHRNEENPLIDEIHLLNEELYEECSGAKVRQFMLGERLKYCHVLDHIRKNVAKNTICIFANADIYTDGTLSNVWEINLENRFLSLLRWEDPNPATHREVESLAPCKLFGQRPDSQDTWIVKSDCIQFDPMPPATDDFNILFGKPGCDNAINVAFLRKKFLVINPALTIKTYHLHSSAIRDYNPTDIVYRPVYLYIDPIAIQEFTILQNLDIYKEKVLLEENGVCSADRPIISIDPNGVATVCTMLKREMRFMFAPDQKNTFSPKQQIRSLYHFTNAFMTDTGLPFGYHELYIGAEKLWRERWEETRTSLFSTTIYAPSLLCLPLPPQSDSHIMKWFLRYLPDAIRVRKACRKLGSEMPELVIPERDAISKLLQLFTMEEGSLTMVAHVQNGQYYSPHLWALSPRVEEEVTPDDIAILKRLLPTFYVPPSHKVVVFCVDDAADSCLSSHWIDELKVLFSGYMVRKIGTVTPMHLRLQYFAEADVMVYHSSTAWRPCDWIWCLQKKESVVIEIMPDMQVTGEGVHLAGVSGNKYILCVTKKEPVEIQRTNIQFQLAQIVLQHLSRRVQIVSRDRNLLPLIILPDNEAQEPVNRHTGDTFREMIRIWEQRGLCRVETSPHTPFVWWGGIGKVLLYDRPTLLWFDESVRSQATLFGNCAPPGRKGVLDSVWSFWPRHPELVEKWVQEGLTNKKYTQRSTQSIFLGRIENGVQMANRNTHNWAGSVQIFSMPVDSTGKAYPFTSEQYLEKLCDSRYGLCLAGFGPKCNREIEYMACGTVPLVAANVDMTNYINPPKEGVHYFRVTDPAQVLQRVANTTEKEWTIMSIACRIWWDENASASGLFSLTRERVHQLVPTLLK